MKYSDLFKLIKHKRDWRECQSKNKKLSAEWDYLIIDNRIYFLFQETNGAQDWIQNFSFTKRKYGDLQFHHGFYELFDLMRDEIIKIVSEHSDKEIYSCGWSQGAALAVLNAQDIYFHTGRKVHLVSFGAPMVAYGKKTRDACRDSCIDAYEFCNRNDVVTYQPPFPNWYHIRRVNIGDKFNLFKLFDPMKYHTNYDEVLDGMAL